MYTHVVCSNSFIEGEIGMIVLLEYIDNNVLSVPLKLYIDL